MLRGRAFVPIALLVVALPGCLGGPGEPEAVRTDTVVIPGAWVFEPPLAEVAAGTTVEFVNRGGAAHTVTFDGLGFDAVLEPGASATYTFAAEGSFGYVCRFHPPDMAGTIRVVAAT